jgi:hypothetical protein
MDPDAKNRLEALVIFQPRRYQATTVIVIFFDGEGEKWILNVFYLRRKAA